MSHSNLSKTDLSRLLYIQRWFIWCRAAMVSLWQSTESQVGTGVWLLLRDYFWFNLFVRQGGYTTYFIFISLLNRKVLLSFRRCFVESQLWVACHRGVPVLWWLSTTRPPPVPRSGNTALPHLLLCQRRHGRTLHTEVELSVREGASQHTNTACVSSIFYVYTHSRSSFNGN